MCAWQKGVVRAICAFVNMMIVMGWHHNNIINYFYWFVSCCYLFFMNKYLEIVCIIFSKILFRFWLDYIPNNLLLTICFADIFCSLVEKATLPLASKLDRWLIRKRFAQRYLHQCTKQARIGINQWLKLSSVSESEHSEDENTMLC